jgi:phage terminase large subunit-like protein
MPRSNLAPRRVTSPLRCHQCGSEAITVSESAQYRRTEGRRRLHADCRCRACKHAWWSRHPVALQRSREADALASAGPVTR